MHANPAAELEQKNLLCCEYMEIGNKTRNPKLDPTKKHCLVWDFIVKKLNAMIEIAGHNIPIDECTWLSESHANLHGLAVNNPTSKKQAKHHLP